MTTGNPNYMSRRDGFSGPQPTVLGTCLRERRRAPRRRRRAPRQRGYALTVFIDRTHALRPRQAHTHADAGLAVDGGAKRVQTGEARNAPFDRGTTNQKTVAQRATIASHRVDHRTDAPGH